MNRVQTAWRIMNLAMERISAEKKLLLLPICHVLGILLVMVLLLLPYLLQMPDWQASTLRTTLESWGDGPFHLLWMCAFYFGVMFVMTFVNVAFYHEMLQSYNGRPLSVRRGFRAALARFPSIFIWAVLSGAIGSWLRALEDLSGGLLRGLLSLLRLGWLLATLFVVPILLREPGFSSPLGLLRKSHTLLRGGTWQEGLTGLFGFNLLAWFGGVSALLAGYFVWIGLGQAFMGSDWAMQEVYRGWGIVVVALASLLFGFFITLLKHVYIAGLYLYASEGVLPEPWEEGVVASDWTVK